VMSQKCQMRRFALQKQRAFSPLGPRVGVVDRMTVGAGHR
jgi:hypothetical protein